MVAPQIILLFPQLATMTGGLIQLVAYGYADLFLTRDPQITFFKAVYRRYTNFTIEQIPQYFKTVTDFGKISTCFISQNSDMIGNVFLVVTLPKIKFQCNDSKQCSTTIQPTKPCYINKFAWVKRIGFSMLKTIEVELNGNLIDRHYGEWLAIWSEITGAYGNYKNGFNAMIGDVPELTEFTTSKNEYTLFIPFYFWFCRSPGLALPIVALQYSDVKINVEFEDVQNCYMLSPTHSIKCTDSMVQFIPNEYIEQNVGGVINAGIFIDYDVGTSILYYYKITYDKLAGIPLFTSTSLVTNYLIVGKTSGFVATPTTNVNSVTLPKPLIKNISLSNCFLLVDYYFLDIEERVRISQSRHDYLIEQLFYTPSFYLNGINQTVNLSINQPCKLLVWLANMDYISANGDIYNYTSSYQRRISDTENYDVPVGSPVGNPLITQETILLNNNARLSLRGSNYFMNTQQYQNFQYTTVPGIHFYSFGLFPLLLQPTGTCNMSQLDDVQLQISLSPVVTPTLTASFRSYAVCYNVLRIVNGLAGLVFSR